MCSMFVGSQAQKCPETQFKKSWRQMPGMKSCVMRDITWPKPLLLQGFTFTLRYSAVWGLDRIAMCFSECSARRRQTPACRGVIANEVSTEAPTLTDLISACVNLLQITM